MRRFLSLVIFGLLVFQHAHGESAGGNGVNNGGDAVECLPASESPFAGYYSLDFLVQYDPFQLPAAVDSLDASLDRIETALRAKLPELLTDFRDFRRGLFNESDPRLSRIWEKAIFGLVDLKDQDLVTLLPRNCRNGEKASIVRAVIRQSPGISGRPKDTYVYRWVPEVVDKLKRTNPVQLSFLIIHEWLWDFSQNVNRNRRLNYWLHSARLENWSREEWSSNLKAIGFSLQGQPEPAFSSEVCPASLDGETKLKALLASGKVLRLGPGSAHQRTRLCIDETGCDARTRDSSNTIRGNFGPRIFVEASPGLLIVGSQGPGVPFTGSFPCRLLASGFSCDPQMITYEGYPWLRQFRFKVEVGRDCLRFVGKTMEPVDGRHTQLDEYVILFSGLRFD